jgi:hypothetical protein
MFQNVKERVFSLTGNRQRPWEYNGLLHRFYFNGKPAAELAAQARIMWEAVGSRSTDSKVLEAFISAYGETQYGEPARTRYSAIQKQGTTSHPSKAINGSPLDPKSATRVTAGFGGLTMEDLEILKARPQLVDYLFEKRCDRLIVYQEFAKSIIEMLKKTDRLAGGPSNRWPLVDDKQWSYQTYLADAIRLGDADLRRMLLAENIPNSETVIPLIYARLVVGHENDQTVDQVVNELRRVDVPLRAETCR